METLVVRDTSEVETFAIRVAHDIALHSEPRAVVIALSGELGAGKTTFTQCLARALGVAESVTSPTFVVMKKYALAHARFRTLVHIDLYRIEDEAELRPLAFQEVLAEPTTVVVVEWPERSHGTIPDTATHITFSVQDDGSRTITYRTHDYS